MPDGRDKPARHGTMSDDERALIGLERRRAATPVGGVKVVEPTTAPEDHGQGEAWDEFTPVESVRPLLDKIEDPAIRAFAIALWTHTGNVDLRSAHRAGHGVDVGGIATEVADLRTELTRGLADIHGVSGTNGKLGELRRRVDALSSKAWWVLTAFVGGIGAAAVKLVMVTAAFTEIRDRSLHQRDEIRLLQAQMQTLQSALLAHDLTPASPEKAPAP